MGLPRGDWSEKYPNLLEYWDREAGLSMKRPHISRGRALDWVRGNSTMEEI